MGFGHRVYKNYDPRAAIVKKAAGDVLDRLGKPDPLLDIAMELEEIALADDYFVERKLYPNVDFYTGLIYRAMGFPTEDVHRAVRLGRLPGWIAQWREMIEDPATKIGRPRQVYTGEAERKFVRCPPAEPLVRSVNRWCAPASSSDSQTMADVAGLSCRPGRASATGDGETPEAEAQLGPAGHPAVGRGIIGARSSTPDAEEAMPCRLYR